MVVGVARLDVRLFAVHSLKQKRSRIRRLLNRLRTQYPLSVAEVGLQDMLQRALIGASMCAGNRQLVESVFRQMEKELETAVEVQLVTLDFEYLHYGEDIA